MRRALSTKLFHRCGASPQRGRFNAIWICKTRMRRALPTKLLHRWDEPTTGSVCNAIWICKTRMRRALPTKLLHRWGEPTTGVVSNAPIWICKTRMRRALPTKLPSPVGRAHNGVVSMQYGYAKHGCDELYRQNCFTGGASPQRGRFNAIWICKTRMRRALPTKLLHRWGEPTTGSG